MQQIFTWDEIFLRIFVFCDTRYSFPALIIIIWNNERYPLSLATDLLGTYLPISLAKKLHTVNIFVHVKYKQNS